MIRVRVRDSSGREVKQVTVPEDGLVVGRAEEADLSLPEKAVSRRHARLYLHDGELVVEDDGSSNGVYVEGVKIDGPTIVEVGQQMRIGTFTIDVEQADGEPVARDSFEPREPVHEVDEPAVREGSAPEVSRTASAEPSEASEVQLIAREGPFRGERFVLEPDETTIGRVRENHVFLDDASVSRRHAKIVRSGVPHPTRRGEDRYILLDLQSSNGTQVNGVKVARQDLHDGDAVQFGDIPFVFSSSRESSTLFKPGGVDRESTARNRRLLVLSALLVAMATVLIVVTILKGPRGGQASLDEGPEAAQADVDRGTRALVLGDLATAQTAFQSALLRDPGSAAAVAGLTRLSSERSHRASFDRAEALFRERRSLDEALALYEAIPADSVLRTPATGRVREIRQSMGAPGAAEPQTLEVALRARYADEAIRAAVLLYARADLAGAVRELERLEATIAEPERRVALGEVRSRMETIEARATEVYREIQARELAAAETSFRALAVSDEALLPPVGRHLYREEVARQVGQAFYERGVVAQATGDFRATFTWWSRGKAIAPASAAIARGLLDLRQRAAQACAGAAVAANQGEAGRARADYELCRDLSEPGTAERLAAEAALRTLP